MKGTVGFAAVLSMVGSVASAQPTTMGEAAGPGYELVLGKASVATSSDAVRLAVDFTAIARAAAPMKLDLSSLPRTTSPSWTVEGQNALTLWNGQSEAPTEPKTRYEIAHSSYFGGYVTAVKGYFTSGWRWGDGDPFFGNNINHPPHHGPQRYGERRVQRRLQGRLLLPPLVRPPVGIPTDDGLPAGSPQAAALLL